MTQVAAVQWQKKFSVKFAPCWRRTLDVIRWTILMMLNCWFFKRKSDWDENVKRPRAILAQQSTGFFVRNLISLFLLLCLRDSSSVSRSELELVDFGYCEYSTIYTEMVLVNTSWLQKWPALKFCVCGWINSFFLSLQIIVVNFAIICANQSADQSSIIKNIRWILLFDVHWPFHLDPHFSTSRSCVLSATPPSSCRRSNRVAAMTISPLSWRSSHRRCHKPEQTCVSSTTFRWFNTRWSMD